MPITDYEITKRYQAKQMSLGLCVNGCKRPLKTKRMCKECCEKNSYKSNRIRNKIKLSLIEKGLCSTNCGRKLVLKWTCRECGDRVNQYARNWWKKDLKKNREDKLRLCRKYRYSGLRDDVLKRDSSKCVICGYFNKICIHHINENPKDNRLDNLVTLCRICHTVVERMNRTKPDMKFIFPWIISDSI